MQTIDHIVALTAPLFILVLLGYSMTRWAGWPKPVSDSLTHFVFAIGIPALLFRPMSDFSRLPPVDPRLLTACLSAMVDKFGLKGETLGEVAAGAVIKHSRDWNLTREAALGSGLHPHTPAYDVQRACGTSLTTAVQLAQRIARGEIDVAIAGGVDTTSDVPVVYSPALNKIVLESARGRSLGQRLKPWLRL